MEEEARKLQVLLVALLAATLMMIITECNDCSCSGDGGVDAPEEVEKVEDTTLEYVQLLYNGKARIQCPVAPTKDFTMFHGHHFVIEGVKIKEKKELMEDSIELVGGKLRHKNDSPVKEKDVLRARAKGSKFVFETSYGKVPVVIRTVASAYEKRKDYERTLDTLDRVKGNRVHAVIDNSGSMRAYRMQILAIVIQFLERSGKKLTGVTFYGSPREIRNVTGTQKQILEEVKHISFLLDGAPESPSHAISQAATKYKPDAFFLMTDVHSYDGTRPKTGGAPVFTIAIGPNQDCVRHMAAIARNTGGTMMHIRVTPSWDSWE